MKGNDQQRKQKEQQQVLRKQQLLSQVLQERHFLPYGQLQDATMPTGNAFVDPSLQTILANDVTELLPYAFQLLAQFVELNRPRISPSYMQIFMLLPSLDS